MERKQTNKLTNDGLDVFQPPFFSKLSREMDLDYFLEAIGASSVIVDKMAYRYINDMFYAFGNVKEGVRLCLTPAKRVNGAGFEYSVTLVYFDGQSNIWVSDASILAERRLDAANLEHSAKYKFKMGVKVVQQGDWKCVKDVPFGKGLLFLQNQLELYKILDAFNRYTAEWSSQNRYDYGMVLLAPHVEVLHKAGFAFVREVLDNPSNVNLWTLFARLCQVGTKPQNIFKVEKAVYDALKNEPSLSVWDKYRKMVKMGRMTPSTVSQARMLGLSEQQLELAHHILGAKYDGKAVFTWQSLVNYLQRLDTFEAIECHDALPLLRDYLSMCQQMEVRPRVDGDSLRREHDVLARLVRLRYNAEKMECLQAGFRCSVEKMSAFNYQEEVFFVRSVESLDDLYNEAKQQRNCVASYANRIADGDSYIFFMREVASPERSLITIEIDPETLAIRQRFLACNQPIRVREQSEFIERWSKWIKSLKMAA